MVQDIFICYSPEDVNIAENICNHFENNNFSCWFKKRDFGKNDTVFKISEEIRSSRILVLVYSKDAKNSNFVRTEVDIAFSSEVPIIIFSIDDSLIDSKLQFYLKDKPKIDAFPDAEQYLNQLVQDSQRFLISSNLIPGGNDAYICYADEDILTAEAICHSLEENGIKCWLKIRDLKSNETVEKIIDVIKKSKCFILVHSKDSDKSNYVKSEINFALSNNIVLLSFNIEDVEKSDMFLNAHWLDAYPNPQDSFKTLISEVGNIVGKPITDPKITKILDFKKEKIKQESINNSIETSKPISSQEFSKTYGIGKYLKIVLYTFVIIIVILIALYFIILLI